MGFEVFYKPVHRDHPIVPETSAELIAAIEAMASAGNLACDFARIFYQDEEFVSALCVGADAVRGLGAVQFSSSVEDLYSQGDATSEHAVFYTEFGMTRFFPRDSEVPLDSVTAVLKGYFEAPGRRPTAIEWQQWEDNEE
ncbi:Imm1 family immunity protein [Glycomyces buryatensis]|uniref:Immunity protein Imm1 n=1 Tax=Glycomyces buryatensis TaxID=2570927 RepID=A0A4S8QIU8_9ACTN|nr:Imm1 family immunity protein [Glycomyces buryatensis]THV41299.1 hypothetical protein FAB82_12095 [Glycomyces buryatensis]